MSRREDSITTRRRSLLKSVAAIGGIGAVTTTARADEHNEHDGFVLLQGDTCVAVEPLPGSDPVEDFYDYRTHGGAYSSHGTVDLQQPDTSILFLYDGPNGTSLVIVHNELGGPGDGGSASFTLSGLPTGGEWVVEDDNYGGPSNYDVWEHGGSLSDIDWTWAESRTDGGAFRGVEGATAITIEPSFNEAADLNGEHYSGTVTDWELLTGGLDNPKRVSLQLDQAVTIKTGTCEPATKTGEGERGKGRGHQKGKGEGHETGNGRGHDKHGDEETESDRTGVSEGEDDDDGVDERSGGDGRGRGPPDDDRGRPRSGRGKGNGEGQGPNQGDD